MWGAWQGGGPGAPGGPQGTGPNEGGPGSAQAPGSSGSSQGHPPAPGPNGQQPVPGQQHELSDMLQMLDQGGSTTFEDLNMFNTTFE